MVYGLYVYPEWGYFPKIELLDGDLKQVKPPNPVNDGGVGWKSHTGGIPVDGSHFPKQVTCKNSKGKPLPDFDQTPRINVSAKARQVIESVEPDTHQFFPVEYLDTKKRHLEDRYWLVVCNRIDGVDREHSTVVLIDGVKWAPAKVLEQLGRPIPDGVDPDQPPRRVYSLSQIGGAHLWSDKHVGGGSYFISDQLANALLEAGLTGLRLAESRAEAV
jgi:type IV secretory pathway protease TraF